MFSKLFSLSQNKLNYLYESSLFLQNIDKPIVVTIIGVFITSTFLSSDVIGFIALITIFLTLVKLLTCKGAKLDVKNFELWLLAAAVYLVLTSLVSIPARLLERKEHS